jgi:hypothetical protein
MCLQPAKISVYVHDFRFLGTDERLFRRLIEQQQQMAAGLNAGVAANGLAGVQELLAQLNLAQTVQGQQQAGGGLGSDVTQV